MFALVVAIATRVGRVVLFRFAMPPRSGAKRWVIGTAWEPYVAVLLVCGLVMSVGYLVLTITDLVVRYSKESGSLAGHKQLKPA